MSTHPFGHEPNAARLLDQADVKDHPLPPSFAVPEVDKAATAYREAFDAYQAARATSGTTMSRYDAEQLDIAAMADAIEAGKPSDATPNVDQHDRELAAHQRQREALAVVAKRREREFRETFDRHRAALIAKHRAATEKRAAKILGLIDDLAAECHAVALDIRSREFAETFPNWPGRARTWDQSLIVARPHGQAPIMSDDLLAGIRETLVEILEPPGDDDGTVTVLGGADSKAA